MFNEVPEPGHRSGPSRRRLGSSPRWPRLNEPYESCTLIAFVIGLVLYGEKLTLLKVVATVLLIGSVMLVILAGGRQPKEESRGLETRRATVYACEGVHRPR